MKGKERSTQHEKGPRDIFWEKIHESEAWRSVFRHEHLDTPRGRSLTTFHNFFLHIYPVKIPKAVLLFRYSFRLGFISAFLFLILLVSGIYLMFFYVPSPAEAYLNMHSIRTEVPFGQFLRNVHRWSAHLMVIVVLAHMLRVFYAAAYKHPRQFNWVLGVGLLVLTLFLSFTGYLLPWDQLAYWAVNVGTNIAGYTPVLGQATRSFLLGSAEVGPAALLRFYVLHIYVLPALLTVILGVHVWRVRKDGFAVKARGGEEASGEAS